MSQTSLPSRGPGQTRVPEPIQALCVIPWQRVEAVRWLLDGRADVRHADAQGNTPPIYAARAPFGKGTYPASIRGRRNEIPQLLQASGPDARRANVGGTAPLHAATTDQDSELVQLVLSAGRLVGPHRTGI